MRKVLFFLLLSLTACWPAGLLPAAGKAQLVEQRTVVVAAINGIEARQRAEQQNPGWRAVDVRAVNPFDPNNRLWEVTIRR